MLSHTVIRLVYLASAVLFMLGLKRMSSPATARQGNLLSIIGMALALAATLASGGLDFRLIIAGLAVGAVIGAVAAIRVEMTSMPEMVALFNGCGGAASALVAVFEFSRPGTVSMAAFPLSTLLLSVLIGGLTFSGSLIAFGKLKGLVPSRPITYPGQQVVKIVQEELTNLIMKCWS